MNRSQFAFLSSFLLLALVTNGQAAAIDLEAMPFLSHQNLSVGADTPVLIKVTINTPVPDEGAVAKVTAPQGTSIKSAALTVFEAGNWTSSAYLTITSQCGLFWAKGTTLKSPFEVSVNGTGQSSQVTGLGIDSSIPNSAPKYLDLWIKNFLKSSVVEKMGLKISRSEGANISEMREVSRIYIDYGSGPLESTRGTENGLPIARIKKPTAKKFEFDVERKKELKAILGGTDSNVQFLGTDSNGGPIFAQRFFGDGTNGKALFSLSLYDAATELPLAEVHVTVANNGATTILTTKKFLGWKEFKGHRYSDRLVEAMFSLGTSSTNQALIVTTRK